MSRCHHFRPLALGAFSLAGALAQSTPASPEALCKQIFIALESRDTALQILGAESSVK